VNRYVEVRENVRQAIGEARPVIALESTIIAHGLPRPRNVEVALQAEEEARKLGVVPATVGILEGKIVVGLTPRQIEVLGSERSEPSEHSESEVLKVSRKDIAFALALKRRGATTVSGTMVGAQLAGIQVFATGGIGGVHRGAGESFDVSADLLELARTPLVVVSAGAKAILDLPKTLEFLETRGVPVLGYRTDRFPAFYSSESNLSLDLTVNSPAEIAEIFRVQRTLGFDQGLLVANPVPRSEEIPSRVMEGYIHKALEQMQSLGISGKAVTPFLLAKVLELSRGKSLETNIRLLMNNVRLACEIAKEIA